jgi:hypothetical protein
MTNNHCPESIRAMISAEVQTELKKYAQEIADKISETLEDMSFDCIIGMPEDWAECAHCESRTLNAQETALSILESELLSAIRQNGTF